MSLWFRCQAAGLAALFCLLLSLPATSSLAKDAADPGPFDTTGSAPGSALGPGMAVSLSGSDASKWSRVLGRAWAQQPIAETLCEEKVGGDCGLARWSDFLDGLRDLPRGEQVRRVDAFVNRVTYRSDREAWGKSDYWAGPGEFFARGGDCEDYAIAKFLSLRLLGFTEEELQIVVVRHRPRRLVHAVLAVSLEGETLVLDNLSSRPWPWRANGPYRPLYALSESSLWLYAGGSAA